MEIESPDNDNLDLPETEKLFLNEKKNSSKKKTEKFSKTDLVFGIQIYSVLLIYLGSRKFGSFS